MLKRLAILAALLVVLPLHEGPQPAPLKNQKDTQPSSHEAEPANRNQSTQPATVPADFPKENGQKSDQEPSRSQNQSDDHSPDYVKLGFIVSIFVALTSLVVAIASFIQARAAKQSADDARIATQFTRNTVRDSERADVLLEQASLIASPTGNIDEYSSVRLRFRNFGRTRAKDVIVEARMIFEQNNTQTQANKIKFGAVTLGPRQAKSVDLQRLNEAFMVGIPTKVLQGAGTLRYYATVSYEDVFGSTYCPQFIGTYNLRTGTFSIDQTS
jgi:hypothetical protein